MYATGKQWGIVGGGILGLTLAYRLRQRGENVTLLESAPAIGGLAAEWTIGDVTWDKHYHVLLLSDSHVRGVLQELGLESECEWVETKTGFFTDGKLYSMSNSIEFLKFPPLRLIDKVRLALTIMRASRIRDWKKLETIPVVRWLQRWSGKRTLEKIWLPLLRAKLGENYRIASAAFIWAIIARMYAARKSGLKKEMFGYVRGGYARILQRFGETLKRLGVDVRTGQRVKQLHSTPAGTTVEIEGSDALRFDRVVVTAASPIVSKLCPQLTPAEHERLAAAHYQGIICASVLLKRPLSRYYVTNITETWVPFTAVIDMTALVNPAEFGGRGLIYLPKYLDPTDPAFEETDGVIRERFLAALERMYPDQFTRDDVVAFQVSRVRHVFPISTIGYSSNVPPAKTSLPGVYIVNSSQLVNGTLNVNETIQLAERALPQLLGG